MRRRLHEIAHPPIERNLRAVDRIAIAIARNRDDGDGAVIVGIVELAVILRDLPVEVHDVTEVIKNLGTCAAGSAGSPFMVSPTLAWKVAFLTPPVSPTQWKMRLPCLLACSVVPGITDSRS